MTINAQCLFACGWETGSALESGWYNSGDARTAISVTTPVPDAVAGVVNGVNVGDYCFSYDNTAGKSGTDLRRQAGLFDANITAGAISGLWYPVTNPTIVGGVLCEIFGFSNNASVGFMVGWDDDEKLCIVDFLGTTTHATSANAYSAAAADWWFLDLRWSSDTRDVWLRIYENGGGWAEKETLHIQLPTWTDSVVDYRAGQQAGTSSAAWHLDNLYVMIGGGMWSPIAPDFSTGAIEDVSSNSTNFVDENGDDYAGDNTKEWSSVDETPGAGFDDADYVEKTNSLLATEIQRYDLEDSIVGAVTILAVGLVGRFYQVPTYAQHLIGMYLGGSTTRSSLFFIEDEVGNTDNEVWGYQEGCLWESQNPDDDDWDTGDVDDLEFEQGARTLLGAECRMSQGLAYVVHGTDSVPDYPIPAAVHRGSQVV